MLGSLIIFLKGMRRMMFQLSGFYYNPSKPYSIRKPLDSRSAGQQQGYQTADPYQRLGPSGTLIQEFPKIRGTLVWGPYNKDPII